MDLRIAGDEVSGFATPVGDRAVAAEEFMAFLRKMPRLAKMYHATLTPDGQPDFASVKAAADVQVVVRVALHSTLPPSL